MQIAEYLSKKKIPIPSETVIQGKRKKVSFKSKKFINLPKEDWVKVENMHEAIISKEDFERAQKVIQATKGSRVVQNDYLFKGLLRCGECKGYIGIRSPDKNGNIYGRCQRYGRFGKFDVCSPHNFNYQVFELQMLEVLKEVCKKYTNKKKLEEIAKQTKTKQSKQLNIQDLEKELAGECNKTKDENRLDNLVDEFLSMKKPTKEIIREFIEKIEIHSDKQVDIYFNFKPLQELKNNFSGAKKGYEKKAVEICVK